MDKLQAGQVAPGATLVVSTRQWLAYDALPPQDGLAHYRFLDKAPVPDVRVERDIGAPPRCVKEIPEIVRLELTHPEVRRRYNLRRCTMRLLTGRQRLGQDPRHPGDHPAHLRNHERGHRRASRKIAPARVPAAPQPGLFMWFGESDKNLDRFFDEIEQLADEPFTASDGTQHKLPVIAVLEEVDGVARARGHEALYDRIMVTALQRLDPTRSELRTS